MTDLSRTIGQRLRKCRENRGWTLEESVKRLGQLSENSVGITAMNMWELGERRPKLEAFATLSRLYGVPASYLAGLDDDPRAGDYYFPKMGPSVPGLLLDSSVADDAVAFRSPFLEECGISRDHLMLVRMPDNSMPGLLNKGDRVLLDLSKRDVTQRDLFALLVRGQIWVRFIRPEIDESFTISSTAPDHYPDVNCTAEELQKFQMIGRVELIVSSR